MAVGFETFEPSGKLQISSEMLIYVLRLSGTTFVENFQVGNTCPTSFAVPGSQTYPNALIALSGGGGHAAAIAGVYGAASTRRYGTTAPVGTPFNYYLFERSNTYPPTNFGIEVLKQTGEIVFSTSQRVMRVLQVLETEDVGSVAANFPGRQLAWCQGAWAGHRIAGPLIENSGGPVIVDPGAPGEGDAQYTWNNDGKIYGGYLANGGATVGTQQISFDDVTIGPTPDPTQPPDYILPLKLFIVDVTGLPVGVQFY
ncbi:hypothetical protein ACNFJ7_02260 [Sphingomonas sp. HT-1]|uniref:hypothetical protein n=1 Tax=unclassified Sphingomonas TaxID=196159 RepID=UPI0002EF3D9A|nr:MULTISPECIES: hypothetical protein [unclassified Sphingomonas]KTF70689.1 hypothetical protein ATB93_18725 [Sphingomonas sp. WG]